ncbi:MAG: GntR family transcriptional regulator [Draconibacterium sp.]|nr:MAG: GntR family transcriptional regulator [Draconibacterium sp.]
MAEIGKYNLLPFVRETENGVYLDGGDLGEILMPRKFVTEEIKEKGDAMVFVYSDSEDRLVATTEKPLAMVGDFAFLDVVAVNNVGAFLDWGLPKNLLVPFSEQAHKMQEGQKCLVYIYLDRVSNRVAASAKINKFLDNTPPEYQHGQKVDLLIAQETDIGYKAIVNGTHWGLLYKNQVYTNFFPGQKTTGYINKVRNDEKIDLLAERPGYEKIDAISEKIIEALQAEGGFLAVSDKSSPQMIQALFGISKKNFKKAIGGLYKKRLIEFVSDGIKINNHCT